MLPTTAGAPLRAMASLTAIWILVRVISWHSSANIVPEPPQPFVTTTANQVVNNEVRVAPGQSLIPLMEGRQDIGEKYRYQSVYIAERSAGHAPIAERSAAIAPDRSRLQWQDSDAVRSFFLETSSTGFGAVSTADARTGPPYPPPPALDKGNRVAAYFWIFARQNSRANQAVRNDGGQSISNGQYGGSQAGAILSYQILDRPVPEISVYGRLSAALDRWSQREAALGTRIQPVRHLPLALHAEQRFDISDGGVSGTAIYATGGTGPDQVVENFKLETYAQGGYVLGPDETYFFDGSATLQRPIAELGQAKLSVGPGAWAGGQRKVHRIDIGPRVGLSVPLGPIAARIALDWRLRVAGDARPGNGAAITVSSGF
ncbi:MAG: hypothetical protein V7679_03610 [Parasphingorhabdus sp.]